MRKTKNNKKLFVVTCLSLATVLGGTLAYFNTNSSIVNTFKTALYQNEIVEKFESPITWTPGTTTEKTVKVTNTGNTDMAIRATFTEKWVNANGEELSLKDENDNIAAIIDFNTTWTKNEDGYYYYGSKDNLTKLMPDDTSSSFINSVTFNENIKANLKETVSEDGQTITYQSDGNGYDNAQYTLTLKLETVQYDQAENIW
ncbi:MAG: hypothetical protein IJ463_07720 [Bacilli bacterium]|nr:hypothetical protein [Bacilli bacterium]